MIEPRGKQHYLTLFRSEYDITGTVGLLVFIGLSPGGRNTFWWSSQYQRGTPFWYIGIIHTRDECAFMHMIGMTGPVASLHGSPKVQIEKSRFDQLRDLLALETTSFSEVDRRHVG
jgi:hypothetical protein